MKILLVHNYYKIAGGEDGVLENEIRLLQSRGHKVIRFVVNNKDINSTLEKVVTFLNTPFAYFQYKKIKKLLQVEMPDIVHVHNYFPQISPSIFYACKSMKVPVVHTLHNYRAVCPTALLMHKGKINEISLKGRSWWTVSKRVYRNSILGSFVLACMVEMHKKIKTWHNKVDCFIALTEFSKQKYIEAGWPSDRIMVKANFIEDPFNSAPMIEKEGGYGLYVGRLSEEKGIDVLLSAWSNIDFKLKVIGEGPLKSLVENKGTSFIEYLGIKEKAEVLSLIKNADFIIMSSTWYEGFPMVLVEAMCCGTPAIVSKLGSMEEIVEDGVTGLHFACEDINELTKKINYLLSNKKLKKEMALQARQKYLTKYTAEINYQRLIEIYQSAIEHSTLI